MIRSLLTRLQVRPEEQTQVVLMLAMGFCLGIFVATYQVTAESLFISELSGQLNRAFLISGSLGILVTLLFSFFQNRVRFITLSIASFLLIVAMTTFLYIAYHTGEGQAAGDVHNFILYGMYCLTGPMTAILLLCYWGVFSRLFDFRQSKRIIGWIDTGQLLAIILANFVIPFTSSFFPDTSNYLLVCNVSIIGALICLLSISTRFDLSSTGLSSDSEMRSQTRFATIFKDRYIVLLGLFLVVSMVVYMFNQFSFQTLLNKQYPQQRDLTNFLAFFNGTIYALSLVMQAYINDRILSTYGLRISLFLLPVVVGILSLGALVIGLVFGYVPEAGSTTFIFFFLAIALTRLLNSMLRESLETPVFKLFFIPLDARFRFNIQSKVEGVINESGRFIAGLFIFAFSLIPFFEIIWICAFVCVLAGVYFLVIQRLYAGYRSKIRLKLETSDNKQDKLDIGFTRITQRLEGYLASETSRAVFSIKLLEKINPANLSAWVNTLMRSPQEEVREYAQKRLNELKGLSVSDSYVIRMDQARASDNTKRLLSKTDLELIIRSGGDITKTRIQRLSRSADVDDRHYAAELLLHTESDDSISFLIELLHDPEPKVRNTAIKTASKKHNAEVIFSLIDNLSSPLFSNQAVNALVLIGAHTIPYLDNAFYRSGQSTQTMLRIVQVMGRIGGQRAKDSLWNKIDYPDKVIVSQVLLSLGEAGFKAGIAQITRIKYAIESDIGDIAWNLTAIHELQGNGRNERVVQALHREIQNDIEHIYMLLAMLYDTRSIQLVKENIESGTTEGTTYAVELLDVFLSDQLKQRVIPVLDDLTVREKINRLEVFFPTMQLDEQLYLKFLINRDFTQSNRWTKACVLNQIGERGLGAFSLDLIAQLFNPDALIRQTAAKALYQINPAVYHENVVRLGEEEKRKLDRFLLTPGEGRILLFDKVVFLQSVSVFEGIPGIGLSYLADLSREVVLKKDQSLSIDEKVNNDFLIVYRGAVQYYNRGKYMQDFVPGQFIGEMVASAGFANANHILAKEDTLLLKFNKDQFYELLSDNVKLADKVLEYI
ncbi:MAG: HEAT repeat domain-containing protein [Cyclobacteriaceae bacterium]|nr:HEAT repeat domain-containing protein [Cyclobacteriaceae bacterium]